MRWLRQLVGKLKSVVGRRNAQGEAAAEATPEKPAVATATETEPTAAEADSATESGAEAEKQADATPAAEAPAAAAEPTSTAEAAEPAGVEPAPAEAVPEPAATTTTNGSGSASAAEPADPATREATNPAIPTLDVEGITAELKAEGPYGPGSGKPAADGAAPSADFTVKGKESSKLFHTEKSPYFSRTKADVWFKSEADAESAGFQAWDHKKRAAAKK